jgi:hypothetical protein
MERVQLIPEFRGSVYEKWSYKFCQTNAWRVRDRLGDFDDCMAQCALYYLECKKFYAGKINSPAHFNYMFKLWVIGQFHDLSKKDYKHRCTKIKLATKKETSIKSEAELMVTLNEASSELKEVLSIFFNAPKEVLETVRNEVKTTNAGKFFRAIVQFCGIAPEKAEDLSQELKNLLS